MQYHELPVWATGRPRGFFKTSAEQGCEMCSRICEAIQCLGFEPQFSEVESWLVLEPITLLPSEIKVLIEEDNLEFGWVTFKIIKNGAHDIKQVQSNDIDTSTSSVCLDKLISRLHECALVHKQCQERPNDGWLPSRLVDIKEFKQSSTVRVASREEVLLDLFGDRMRYLTLSHVWGHLDFLTLTTSNIQQLRSGIPVSQLPRTFKDAIAVTSQIGLRYLWVDSLCIIQDSEVDWSVEAGLMNKVYLNSFCNIASSLSTRPEEGLFWDRNSALAGPFPIKFNPRPYATQFDVFLDLQFLILNHAPLYKRGWVLQESLLSPRTIHFSTFPALECRELFTCESYSTTGPQSISADSHWLFHTTKKILKSSFRYADWREIVHDYSRCQLTMPTDKLIALSGITKALSSVIPGSYYGGIWLEWWLTGLLWFVDQWLSGDEMAPIRLNKKYIAPYWSWASVNGPILPWATSDAITSRLVDLVSIHTIPTSGDPFGQLTSGEIVLKAKLFHLPNFKALAELDRGDLPAYTLSLDDCGNHFHDKDTFFIPLVDSPRFLSDEELTICGLLLQAVEGGMDRQKAFQRVGFAAISHVDGNVANSGCHLEHWKPPPWPEEELQHIVIV